MLSSNGGYRPKMHSLVGSGGTFSIDQINMVGGYRFGDKDGILVGIIIAYLHYQ